MSLERDRAKEQITAQSIFLRTFLSPDFRRDPAFYMPALENLRRSFDGELKKKFYEHWDWITVGSLSIVMANSGMFKPGIDSWEIWRTTELLLLTGYELQKHGNYEIFADDIVKSFVVLEPVNKNFVQKLKKPSREWGLFRGIVEAGAYLRGTDSSEEKSKRVDDKPPQSETKLSQDTVNFLKTFG